MPNGTVDIAFYDSWTWLVFIAFGLLLIILELMLGIDTGLDMVFIGTAFILGGLITLSMHSWVWSALATGIICIVYVALGRRYVHRRMTVSKDSTNVDAIIGKTGIVLKGIDRVNIGTVKVGMEEWRARSEETINEGEEIIVTGVSGVTLTVKTLKEGEG